MERRPILYILDASFNPPTLAHKFMIESFDQVLLCFSVQNADKGTSHDLDKRRQLMNLLGPSRLIEAPRFIDKVS